MKILFVTNTSLKAPKGGWDGLGYKIWEVISKGVGNLDALDCLDPKLSTLELYFSRFQKLLKIPRIYPSFSRVRLVKIAKHFKKSIGLSKYSQIIFHGSTPWVLILPDSEYSVILDCSFPTYIKTYLPNESFKISSIDFIKDKEKLFLSNASNVFFTSKWAMNETRIEYGLNGRNFVYMGQGPSINFPKIDLNNCVVKNQLVLVATDFIGKGGLLIFDAFKKLVEIRKDYLLMLVGQRPPSMVLEHPNVKYLGYINKSNEAGIKQFAKLYSESKANFLLSNRDILPLVIIESGLCGCPSVATAFNAIPELIEDRVTGWIIQQDGNILFDTMIELTEMDDTRMKKMRLAVQQKMENEFNWNKIKMTLLDNVN